MVIAQEERRKTLKLYKAFLSDILDGTFFNVK
jgi:hypothetical protein